MDFGSGFPANAFPVLTPSLFLNPKAIKGLNKKKLVTVRTDSINNPPIALQCAGASWSMMFNFDSIKKALDGV